MIEAITFQVQCVSPTLNLGANKHPEHEIFRAPSLRGCWRFWARAAIAGAMEKPCSATLRRLEDSLFGSTEPAFQAFRLRVIPCNSPKKDSFLILPHKHQGKQTGFSPGSTAEVRISLHQKIWSDQARNALLAVIWLWDNLGGIGTRSRRGFGSVVLLPDADGKDALKAAGLPECCDSFASRNALIEHLQTGIEQSFQLIREWIAAQGCAAKLLQPTRSANKDMFVLNSLAQIFVGTEHATLGAEPAKTAGLLQHISDKKVMSEESGSASPRLASPMLVRIHQCAEGCVPVLTWSPRNKTTIAKAAGNGPWLKDLGFDMPLQGNSIHA